MRPAWLDTFVTETEASPEAVDRLQAAMLTATCPARMARHLPQLATGAEQRLVQRVLAPPTRKPSLWIPVAAVGTLAVAVAALIISTVSLPEPAPASLSGPLTASADLVEVAPGVLASAQGEGLLAGTPEAPIIYWSAGELRLEITPGTPLTVLTDEGTARVKGTIFEVRRDVMGTTVEVDRGLVAVDCIQGDSAELGPEAHTTCLPRGAAALNARARALSGTDLAEAIESVSLALATPDLAPAVQGESLALRAELHYRAADAPLALEDASTYLDQGHQGRELEMRGIVHWASGEIEGEPGTP